MKINLFHQNENDIVEYRNAIKYWSNSLGELHHHGDYEISEYELPVELRRVYTDLDIFERYSSRCYLVETAGGYGIALINEYDEDFANDCNISMAELFNTVIKDVNDISLLSCFNKAEIYIGENMGVDESHELAVVFPANISQTEYDTAAKMLDNIAYYNARLMSHNNPEVDTPYLVTVTETYKRSVVVYAKDQYEAEQYAEDLCNESKINLDFDDFTDRTTECRGVAQVFQINHHEVFNRSFEDKDMRRPRLDHMISAAESKSVSSSVTDYKRDHTR